MIQTQSEQMLLEKKKMVPNGCAQCRVATNLQSAKIATSVKSNRVKHNKMTCAQTEELPW